MANMKDFKVNFNGGFFSHYFYNFHNCHAHISRSFHSLDGKLALFYSYNTVMAGIVAKGNVYLRKDFDCYSRTTTRQVTRFLSEMCGAPLSVNDLRKWRKEGGNHCGIVFVPIDFIYEHF